MKRETCEQITNKQQRGAQDVKLAFVECGGFVRVDTTGRGGRRRVGQPASLVIVETEAG